MSPVQGSTAKRDVAHNDAKDVRGDFHTAHGTSGVGEPVEEGAVSAGGDVGMVRSDDPDNRADLLDSQFDNDNCQPAYHIPLGLGLYVLALLPGMRRLCSQCCCSIPA